MGVKNILRKSFEVIKNAEYKHNINSLIRDKSAKIYGDKKRIRSMLKNGFSSDEYYLYNFAKNSKKDYITQYERWMTRNINGKYKIILDDKILFYAMFSKYIKIPKNIFSILNDGEIVDENGKINEQSFFAKEGSFCMKPSAAAGGFGVSILKIKDNQIFVNDEIWDKTFSDFCKRYENYLICELITQNNYSSNIAPNSVNTIRIITIKDSTQKTFKCVVATHRFGSKKSGCVDNASRGGYFSLIDLDSGRLGKLASYYDTRLLPKHPDFDTQVENVLIPNWTQLKEKLEKIHEKLFFLNFIAWDIAVVDNDIYAVEANASSDLELIQIFGGLRNSELGKFYRSHGCLLKKYD